MSAPRDIVAEISSRIQADTDHFGGLMPERNALAWRGYLAAMLEWNVIPIAEYEELLTHLPTVTDDPAIAILRGRD